LPKIVISRAYSQIYLHFAKTIIISKEPGKVAGLFE